MIITEAAQSKVDQVLNGEGFLGGMSGRWRMFRLPNKAESPLQRYLKDAQMLSDTIFSDAFS